MERQKGDGHFAPESTWWNLNTVLQSILNDDVSADSDGRGRCHVPLLEIKVSLYNNAVPVK